MKKNKEKKAAAIAYTPPEPAPKILASGKNQKAELILEEARKAGISIVEDPGLAALLEAAKPGDYIPAWCWEATAKILSFVYSAEKSSQKSA